MHSLLKEPEEPRTSCPTSLDSRTPQFVTSLFHLGLLCVGEQREIHSFVYYSLIELPKLYSREIPPSFQGRRGGGDGVGGTWRGGDSTGPFRPRAFLEDDAMKLMVNATNKSVCARYVGEP